MPRRFDGRDEDDDEELQARMASSSEPRPLREPLERLIGNLGAPPVSVLTRLRERWPDLVGEGLAETTRPTGLVDGVLTVACADGVWAAQIAWSEGQIRQRFDEIFGAGQLERVVTRVDR